MNCKKEIHQQYGGHLGEEKEDQLGACSRVQEDKMKKTVGI